MKRILASGGLATVAAIIFYAIVQRDRKHAAVYSLRSLIGNMRLSEEQQNFERTNEENTIILIGARCAESRREGWFEYRISVLMEGDVRASVLQGSLITVLSPHGHWLGEMVLVANEPWTLDASICLPDPQVQFILNEGLADYTSVFSYPPPRVPSQKSRRQDLIDALEALQGDSKEMMPEATFLGLLDITRGVGGTSDDELLNRCLNIQNNHAYQALPQPERIMALRRAATIMGDLFPH